jgi:hypothetical protein
MTLRIRTRRRRRAQQVAQVLLALEELATERQRARSLTRR